MVYYKKKYAVRTSFTWFKLMIDHQNGAYEEVIPTSSQILSKLDLDILILVQRTRFVHITSIINQNRAIESAHILVPMCTHLRFCVYVATPLTLNSKIE